MHAVAQLYDQNLTPLEEYVSSKISKNAAGGRPHFLYALSKTHNPKEELLNICELAWLKNKTPGNIAAKYDTGYHTIYRLLQELEPFKTQIIEYLQKTPRRKKFYNRELKSSDYETVQRFINRCKRDGVGFEFRIPNAVSLWRALNYKDPANWTHEDVLTYMDSELKDKPGMQASLVDAIRAVGPQFAQKGGPDEIKIGRFREKIKRRKKDIFGDEFRLIREGLIASKQEWELDVIQTHVAIGAREGTHNDESGICGLTWDRFKEHFTKVDLWESKVRGGIWSRDCPLDLLFKDLPARLEAIWNERGRPMTEKVIRGGYPELKEIYRTINKALAEYWSGKLEPSVYNEITHLRPHDADKIHVNLLWEARVPLEVVGGNYLGKGEGVGLVGRIWLDINVIKKYYLSLNVRSKRMKRIRSRLSIYAQRFNSDSLELSSGPFLIRPPLTCALEESILAHAPPKLTISGA